MEYRFYDTLPDEAFQIRREVFVEEQGFRDEFDEDDKRAVHLVVFEEGRPIGTCRFFKKSEDGAGYLIGRIAVRSACRKKHMGARMMEAAEERIRELGGRRSLIHAQVQAQGFYEKQGYRAFGEVEPEQGCPHIWMSKEL